MFLKTMHNAIIVWKYATHDDVIKWKHIPRSWPFVRGIHRSPVNYPHKGQWRGALMFSLICVWINGWVNNREAGDFQGMGVLMLKIRRSRDRRIFNMGIPISIRRHLIVGRSPLGLAGGYPLMNNIIMSSLNQPPFWKPNLPKITIHLPPNQNKHQCNWRASLYITDTGSLSAPCIVGAYRQGNSLVHNLFPRWYFL